MRIEELQNNLMIKSTDTVEKYLLNIIQEYFKDSNEALEGSKEYIIREAVDRLKTEMDYNSLGVISITLPSGEVKVGDVSITLEDLNGEPLISPKLSAFNVNFGKTANTACEGNDPRLYDARPPIAHEHEISEVMGLSGILSTIIGKMDSLGVYNHTHSNKALLDILTYTGSKDSIDLGILETLEPKIIEITDQIRENIITYTTNTETEIENINTKIVEINHRIDNIYQYVLEKCEDYLLQAKQYTDLTVENTINDLKTYIDTNYIKKADIEPLIEIANKCYTLVGTEKWKVNEIYLQNIDEIIVSELTLSQKTIDELTRRSIYLGSSKEIIFEFSLLYKDPDNPSKIIKQKLPYLDNFNYEYEPFMYPLLEDLTVTGYIQTVIHSNNILKIEIKTNGAIPSHIVDGSIICDIYAKDYCAITI